MIIIALIASINLILRQIIINDVNSNISLGVSALDATSLRGRVGRDYAQSAY